ncbi:MULTISPECIES: ABC transporter permease [unclassified Paenibacillus]|uniref:ABC transporter permease n=1 Tax=unclassified Paenibacillus TaxID=185978 RepID=UPI0007BF0F0C|nr:MULTISPECIES: ABC transporter permease [unclassified Paenibacillus]SEB26029.1 hypothetical protein SAMN03159332_5434 [Paenibacillus sp. 276b]
MNPIQIHKYIIKKSKKTYYRMVVIVSLIFIIISSYAFFYMFNQLANKENFYNNTNAHLIRIEGKMSNNILGKLSSEDVEQTEYMLRDRGERYKLSKIFKLSSGIMNASDNKGMILYGLDETFSNMLNQHFEMKDNVLYSETGLGELSIIIPHIQFTEQGDIQSNSFDEKTFQLKNIYDAVDKSNMAYFFSRKVNDLPMVFATQDTLVDILNIMFKDNMKETDNGELHSYNSIYDFIDVEEVLIYIDDIQSLGELVEQFRSSDFLVSYAFDSFESLSTDLWKSNMLYNIILVLLVMISMIYIALTYRNYLKSQQKDFGIFKIFGYSDQSICRIYNQVLFKLFGSVFVIAFIFNLIICFNRWGTFMLIFALESLMLLFIVWFISQYQIRRVINKGVLFLVKDDKEFE